MNRAEPQSTQDAKMGSAMADQIGLQIVFVNIMLILQTSRI